MKKYLLLALLPVVAACQAQAPADTAKFDKMFAVISTDKIYATTFPALIKQLDGMCKPIKKAASDRTLWNVECEKNTRVKGMQVSPLIQAPVSTILVEFDAVDKCEYMRKILTKKYGKPSSTTAPCHASWAVKAGKDGNKRTASLEPGKDHTVYFEMTEDEETSE